MIGWFGPVEALVLVLLVLVVAARRRPADPVSGPLRGRDLALVVLAHLAPLLQLPGLLPLALTILLRRNVRIRARVARAFELQVGTTLLAHYVLRVLLATGFDSLDDLVWIDWVLVGIGVAGLALGVTSVVSAYRGSRLLTGWRPLLTPVFARDAAAEDVPEATPRPR